MHRRRSATAPTRFDDRRASRCERQGTRAAPTVRLRSLPTSFPTATSSTGQICPTWTCGRCLVLLP